jgi:hypothetical protein
LSANGSWVVLADTHNLEVVVDETTENAYIYFTYEYGQKTIKIIGTNAIQPLDKTSPTVNLSSPQSTTYVTESCILTFTVNEEISWMGYSLDEQSNVTLTENTVNITGLTDGSHTLVVYANDTAGNMGVSETITFYILSGQTLALVMIVVVTAAVAVGASLLYYRKTRSTRKF